MRNNDLKYGSFCAVEPQVAVGQQTSFLSQGSAVIRFLSFPIRFNPECRLESDYEREYEAHSLNCSPSFGDLKIGVSNFREFYPIAPGDVEFWKQLRFASDGMIYFVDLYFDARNLNRIAWICDYFSGQNNRKSTHIVVLTCQGDEFEKLRKEYESGRELIRSWKNVDITVYVIKDRELLHDRFVMFDKKFWHFGASAGGMHAGLNAYSGPWSDEDGKLASLIDRLLRKGNSKKILSIDGSQEEEV